MAVIRIDLLTFIFFITQHSVLYSCMWFISSFILFPGEREMLLSVSFLYFSPPSHPFVRLGLLLMYTGFTMGVCIQGNAGICVCHYYIYHYYKCHKIYFHLLRLMQKCSHATVCTHQPDHTNKIPQCSAENLPIPMQSRSNNKKALLELI